MQVVFEDEIIQIVRPWTNAGLRIIEKNDGTPWPGTGAFYDNMDGYDPDSIKAARLVWGKIKKDLTEPESDVDF